MSRTSSGFTDIYAVTPVPTSFAINFNSKGATLRAAQTLNSAVKNLIIISPGQSNNTNIAPSAYTPSNPTVLDQFNITDGASYAAADPQLGCSINPAFGAGHPMLRLADSYIGTFDHVTIVPIAIDSTLVVDWATGFCAGRIITALRRLAARGIIEGTNVTICVAWGQGESDNVGGTSQSAYTNSLNSVITQSRVDGFAGRWFVAQQTYFSGAASATIQAAQAAVVNHGANVYAGPNADALIGSTCSAAACRIGDNTHWTDAGSASYAAIWKTAMAASGAPF